MNGGSWPVGARLAVRSAARRPAGWTTAVAVVALAVVVGGWRPHGPPLSLVLAVVLALSLAGSPEPDDVRTGAALHLMGAKRRNRSALVFWATAIVLGPGLLVGLLCAVLAASTGRLHLPSLPLLGLIPAAGLIAASVAGYRRLRAEERLGGRRHNSRATAAVDVGLFLAGTLLVAASAAVPSLAHTGSDLSLLLVAAFAGIGLGLLMALPVLVKAPRWLLAHLPLPPPRMAAGRPLPGIGLSIWLLALGTAAVIATSIVGYGLVAREGSRRAALHQFDFRTGSADDQVVVSDKLDFLGTHGRLSLDDRVIAAVAKEPAVTSTVVIGGPASSLSSLRIAPGSLGRIGDDSVGVATPEVLAALGLTDRKPYLDGGGALALNPNAILAGKVTVRSYRSRADAGATFHLRARSAWGRRVATALPAALVSPATAARLSHDPVKPLAVLLRGPQFDETARGEIEGRLRQVIATPPRPTFPAQVGPSTRVTSSDRAGLDQDLSFLGQVQVQSGATRIDPEAISRSDAPEVTLLRDQPSLVTALLTVLLGYGVMVLIANRFVALSRRQEDEMLEVLGAPPSLLPRVAAAQAGTVAVIGVIVGSVIGLAGTAFGIAHYNRAGRFGTQGPVYSSIPYTVAPILLAALILLPLLSAAAAAVTAMRRHPLPPYVLGERLVAEP